MSLSVNDLIGFNQTVYDDLKTNYTNTTGKSASDFDKLLINLSQEGKLSFQDVTREVYDTLPKPLDLIGCTSITPSFGSTYLALITDMSSEERRQNAEMRALQTEEMVDKIQEQADTIRDKAIVQLVTGIVTGTLSIAQGVASIGMTVKSMSASKKAADTEYIKYISESTDHFTKFPEGKAALSALAEQATNAATLARQRADAMLTAKVQAVNSMMTGSNSILGSIGQCVATMYDAELKESEADVERIRAQQQQLESLDESLKALIQKALSTQDTIQQNLNQTRTKILG